MFDSLRDPELIYYMVYQDNGFVCKFTFRNPVSMVLNDVYKAEEKYADRLQGFTIKKRFKIAAMISMQGSPLVSVPKHLMKLPLTMTAYEDIFFDASTATIRQVKATIATQLGIEADEFVFDNKYDNNKNKHTVDMLFADKYLPNNYEPDMDINGDWVPFELSLFKNEKYKGTTGILSWIISQKRDLYCAEYDYDGGQLAHGFAKNIAAFKAQYNATNIY
ncbi:hypothetical protein IWW37_003218 [Coemansia sp. RSA 2050]|nr:hypothetical protein IWW37_003218 [Coemansia sp. RSA 2050]